jgi:hypothetical protein
VVITDAREAVKVWDVRAKSIVYELATGNNEVQSLAWDSVRDTLYASVACQYKTRMGDYHGYRKAKVPRSHQIPGEEWEEDEDEDEVGDELWEGRCWPENARHDELYFNYTFDAARDGIRESNLVLLRQPASLKPNSRPVRYQFKQEPNPKYLPEYGEADLRGSGGGFW